MKPYIHIKFPSGQSYEVPAAVIANHRAQVMFADHPDEFKTIDEAIEDSVGLFEDNYAIEDWARNNMNWGSDIEPHARMVRFAPPEIDHVNDAEWSHVEMPALLAEPDGDAVLASPLGFTAGVMASTGQLCNLTVLTQPNEAGEAKPYAAVAVLLGNEHVIGAYTQALQLVGNALTAGNTTPTH